jgi:hypothetical protein
MIFSRIWETALDTLVLHYPGALLRIYISIETLHSTSDQMCGLCLCGLCLNALRSGAATVLHNKSDIFSSCLGEQLSDEIKDIGFRVLGKPIAQPAISPKLQVPD